MSKISFTIVTVVKNAELLISETLNSILNQSYKNYELILVDGVSTDSTLKKASNILSSANIKSTILCGPDVGIYDAMNKGVVAASGDYTIFINAGDAFYSDQTLESLAKLIFQNPDFDIYYGDSFVSYGAFKKFLKAGSLNKINCGMQFSHQSTLVLTRLLKTYPFSLRYKIASDYNFLLKAYQANWKFKYLQTPIAITLHGGMSDSKRLSTYSEYISIVNRRGFKLAPSFMIFLMMALDLFKRPIKVALGYFKR